MNSHGAEAKDYVISFLDPKEYVKTLVSSYQIESLDFKVEFEIENTGRFQPQEAVSRHQKGLSEILFPLDPGRDPDGPILG